MLCRASCTAFRDSSSCDSNCKYLVTAKYNQANSRGTCGTVSEAFHSLPLHLPARGQTAALCVPRSRHRLVSMTASKRYTDRTGNTLALAFLPCFPSLTANLFPQLSLPQHPQQSLFLRPKNTKAGKIIYQ